MNKEKRVVSQGSFAEGIAYYVKRKACQVDPLIRDALGSSVRWPKSVTAILISPWQFQFHHNNFNFITTISVSPQQSQLHHSNFNCITAISTSFSLMFMWTNSNCHDEIEIAVGKLKLLWTYVKLPWHFWATILWASEQKIIVKGNLW